MEWRYGVMLVLAVIASCDQGRAKDERPAVKAPPSDPSLALQGNDLEHFCYTKMQFDGHDAERCAQFARCEMGLVGCEGHDPADSGMGCDPTWACRARRAAPAR